jgi:hypothetical protein
MKTNKDDAMHNLLCLLIRFKILTNFLIRDNDLIGLYINKEVIGDMDEDYDW